MKYSDSYFVLISFHFSYLLFRSLSHSFRNAQSYLGNIHTLLLSHNHLTSVAGIDHLCSLSTLALDHNYLSSFAEVARLAYNLPQLMDLSLNGNPLSVTQPTKTLDSTTNSDHTNYHRLDVWNIFWEARSNATSNRANSETFSLSSLFPVLDGHHITTREWALLKQKGIFWERLSTIHTSSGKNDDIYYTKSSNCSNTSASTTSSIASNLDPVHAPSSTSRRYIPKVTRRNRTRLANIKNKESFDDDTFSTSLTPLTYKSAIEQIIRRNDTDCLTQQYQIQHVIAALSCSDEKEENSIKLCDRTKADSDAADRLIKLNNEGINSNSNYKMRKERSKDWLLSIFEEAASNEKYYDYAIQENITTTSSQALCAAEAGAMLLQSSSFSSSFDTSNNSTSFTTVEDATATPTIKNNENIHNAHNAHEHDQFNRYNNNNNNNNNNNIKVNVKLNLPQDTKEKQPPRSDNKNKEGVKKKKKDADRVPYDGHEELSLLPVTSNNLELYYQYFIFCGHNDLRIRLRESDKSSMDTTMQQSFVGLWKDLSVIACGKAAVSRLGVHIVSRRGFHGNVLPSSFVSCEKQHIIVLSDVALYFIPTLEDHIASTTETAPIKTRRKFPSPIPNGARFQDGWLPHSAATHGLVHLKRMTIGFGFQRLTLHFVIPNNSATKVDDEKQRRGADGVTVFCYVIFTCSKKKSIALLQQLQSRAKEAIRQQQQQQRNELLYDDDEKIGADGPFIDNDDKIVLDSLYSMDSKDKMISLKMKNIGTVLHYQIVQQKWKHAQRSFVRRVCVVTDENILLLDEDYFGDGCDYASSREILGSVRLQLVDIASLSQIIEICAASQDPCVITLVIRKKISSKLLSSMKPDHKWRIICKDGEAAEVLVDEVRRAKIYKTLPPKHTSHE
jgi:hypothetical protein